MIAPGWAPALYAIGSTLYNIYQDSHELTQVVEGIYDAISTEDAYAKGESVSELGFTIRDLSFGLRGIAHAGLMKKSSKKVALYLEKGINETKDLENSAKDLNFLPKVIEQSGQLSSNINSSNDSSHNQNTFKLYPPKAGKYKKHLIETKNLISNIQQLGRDNKIPSIKIYLINRQKKAKKRILQEDKQEIIPPASISSKSKDLQIHEMAAPIGSITEDGGRLQSNITTENNRVTSFPIKTTTYDLAERFRGVYVCQKTREEILSRVRIISDNDLKKLGFFGTHITDRKIFPKTGLIRLHTELIASLEEAQEFFHEIPKKLFAHTKVEGKVKPLYSKTTNAIIGEAYHFEDGSLVQYRWEGKSGHIKIEITNIALNIYEKIT